MISRPNDPGADGAAPGLALRRSREPLGDLARRLRLTSLEMAQRAGVGHPGGCLSVVEILIALYYQCLEIRPEEPSWRERDRLVYSKGHASAVLYAVLADLGYFDRRRLADYCRLGEGLPWHPNARRTAGVDFSSGSLGQGLSVAAGMALGARLSRLPCTVWAVTGDGEMQEGQVWEALSFASHRKLGNLLLVVDANGRQQTGRVADTLAIEPLPERLAAFGWGVQEVDGHSVPVLIEAMTRARGSPGPQAIVARTTKGKGVSFMEDVQEWHVKTVGDNDLRLARTELATGGGGMTCE